MRRPVLVLALLSGLFGTPSVWCETIAQVLDRSQDMRLAALDELPGDTAAVQRLQADFDRLVSALAIRRAVRLRVVHGPLWAEAVHGGLVVANETLADLPEGARLFVLAHELGHVTLDHWSQMSLLFQKWVPGEVTQQRTDAVAPLLGRDAAALAHRQEFEADAFAAQALKQLKVPMTDMFDVFGRLGVEDDTPTHPSAAERVAALRALGLRDPARMVVSGRHPE